MTELRDDCAAAALSIPRAARGGAVGAGSGARPGVGAGRAADGRRRLLAAAERLFAIRGLEVPNRDIVAAAGQHNRSAVTYHFTSRAQLIEAIRERHEIPIAQHRQHLVARLPGPAERTTRQLVEAHVQPLASEMLRCAPSYWARLNEMLLAAQPPRRTRDTTPAAARGSLPAAARGPLQPPVATRPALAELMVAHLSHLPLREAADRVALAVRFLNSGLAGWERDTQEAADEVAPLVPFTLTLTDLAVAMLDAPSSAPVIISS